MNEQRTVEIGQSAETTPRLYAELVRWRHGRRQTIARHYLEETINLYTLSAKWVVEGKQPVMDY